MLFRSGIIGCRVLAKGSSRIAHIIDIITENSPEPGRKWYKIGFDNNIYVYVCASECLVEFKGKTLRGDMIDG